MRKQIDDLPLTEADKQKLKKLTEEFAEDMSNRMNEMHSMGFRTGLLVGFNICLWITIIMKITIGDIL